jgi:hypothetical protein
MKQSRDTLGQIIYVHADGCPAIHRHVATMLMDTIRRGDRPRRDTCCACFATPENTDKEGTP